MRYKHGTRDWAWFCKRTMGMQLDYRQEGLSTSRNFFNCKNAIGTLTRSGVVSILLSVDRFRSQLFVELGDLDTVIQFLAQYDGYASTR